MDNKDFESNLGSLNGFDSAEPFGENGASPEVSVPNPPIAESQPQKPQEKVPEESYTVTPAGGYYDAPKPAEAEPTKPPQPSFFPSGNYGTPPAERPPAAPTPTSYYDPRTAAAAAPQKPKKTKKKKAKPPKKGYGLGVLIAVSLIVSLLTSGAFLGVRYLFPETRMSQNESQISSQKSESNNKTKTEYVYSDSIDQLAINASNAAGSSVVGVSTTVGVQNFFGGVETYEGSGSGVIYREDGYIITNYHVIEDSLQSRNATITVYLDNDIKNGYEATVVNYNISYDLAVLKINKTGLPAIARGNSDDLKIGQYVVAIGSPEGLDFIGSTTLGIVSGLNRTVATSYGDMSLIQTDAAINPGNSGGALVNANGELVGICNSKYVSTDIEGMGFAIPVNTVVEICDSLIKNKNKGEPYTGISINANYSADVLAYYGYPEGAVVANVDSGSPAATAGIGRGDIITSFAGKALADYTGYFSILSSCSPGDEVEIVVYRSGKYVKAKMTIGSAN